MHGQLSLEKNISQCMEGFFKQLGPVPNYPTLPSKSSGPFLSSARKKEKNQHRNKKSNGTWQLDRQNMNLKLQVAPSDTSVLKHCDETAQRFTQ